MIISKLGNFSDKFFIISLTFSFSRPTTPVPKRGVAIDKVQHPKAIFGRRTSKDYFISKVIFTWTLIS